MSYKRADRHIIAWDNEHMLTQKLIYRNLNYKNHTWQKIWVTTVMLKKIRFWDKQSRLGLKVSGILMLGSQHALGTSWSARELHHCTRDYIINTFVLSAEMMRVLLLHSVHFGHFWCSKMFHWNWSIVKISFKIDLGYNNLWAIRNLLLFGILYTEKMRRWPLNLYILRILIFYRVFYEIMWFLFSLWI